MKWVQRMVSEGLHKSDTCGFQTVDLMWMHVILSELLTLKHYSYQSHYNDKQHISKLNEDRSSYICSFDTQLNTKSSQISQDLIDTPKLKK